MARFTKCAFLPICIVVASASASAQEAPSASRSSKIAESYAATYGVSISEAKKRLAIQRVAGALNARLEKEQAATFGGMYIEHTPSFRVVAKFTRDGAATLKRYTNDTTFATAPAAQSYIRLTTTQASSYRLLKAIGIESASLIDVKEGKVRFFVEQPTAALLRMGQTNLAGKPSLRLPSYVVLEQATNLKPQREARIEGGRPLSGGACTSGFTVFNRSSGSNGPRYLTTAGHCPNSLSYNGSNLPIAGENYQANSNNDFQWHTAPAFDRLTNVIYDGLGRLVINYVVTYQSMMTGEFVCKYGASTNYTCGSIISKSYNFIGSPGFVVVHDSQNRNLSDPGDSGAPWYNDEFNEAWGSHSDSSRNNPNDAVFMPIENVRNSNLAVLTTP